MDEEQEQTDGLASAELDEEQDPWNEGGWYFDLPEGAWERQEAKNRALRQNIRANVKQDSALRAQEAKKNPFTGPSGSFGGWVDDVVAERGPAGKPTEVWGAATDEQWEGTGAAGPESSEEWGNEPPAVIVKPSEPGNPAWEFPAAELEDEHETDSFEDEPRAEIVPPGSAATSDEPAEWGKPGVERDSTGLPPLRRGMLPERAIVSESAAAEGADGEKRSRWDEMFGGVADTSIVDSMREWQEREKEELARERDVTRLAPEMLAPFDWELAEEDRPAVPEGTLFSAPSYEDDEEDDELDNAEFEVEATTGWATKPAGDAPEGWDDDEPATAASAPPIVPAAAMNATSWDRLADEAEADPAKGRKGGFMSRILGRKQETDAAGGPAWAANGPAEWTAREASPTGASTGPRPPAPTPTEGDWAEVEGRDDDMPLNYRPAPVAQSERMKAPAAGSGVPATEHPRGWGAPPTDDDGSVHYELPKRFQGRDVWDDGWLEAPADDDSLPESQATAPVAAAEPAAVEREAAVATAEGEPVAKAEEPETVPEREAAVVVAEAPAAPVREEESTPVPAAIEVESGTQPARRPAPAAADVSDYASGPVAELLEAELPRASSAVLPPPPPAFEPAAPHALTEERTVPDAPAFEPLAEAAATIAKPRESEPGFAADSEPPILHAESGRAVVEPGVPAATEAQTAGMAMPGPTSEENDAAASPADDPWAAFLVAREPTAAETWIKRDREVRRAG